MSYHYGAEKPRLFTEEGQMLFIDVRDRVQELLQVAGAFRFTHVKPKAGAYDSWLLLACIDRLVEIGEIVEVPRTCWTQYKVYSSPKVSNL